MTSYLRIALAATSLALPFPVLAATPTAKAVTPQPIIVSCYRGPTKEVIWDRPNPRFITSLIAAGYDDIAANVIGMQICRNPALVDNPEGLKVEMTRLYRESLTDGLLKRRK